MNHIPVIPDSAPFTLEQRAWLNGFLAGLFSQAPASQTPASLPTAAPAPQGPPLLVLFGSQSGSAEGLAKRTAKAAEQRGFSVRTMALNDCDPVTLAAGGRAVIISSTWGDGDPPDNAASFWTWLSGENAPRLEQLQFAVLGLGDKNYADFCGAAKKFDARLESLGAKRVLARGECDVDYELPAGQWLEEFWSKAAPPEGNGSVGLVAVNGARLGLERNGQSAARINGSHTPGVRLYDKSNPFPAR